MCVFTTSASQHHVIRMLKLEAAIDIYIYIIYLYLNKQVSGPIHDSRVDAHARIAQRNALDANVRKETLQRNHEKPMQWHMQE